MYFIIYMSFSNAELICQGGKTKILSQSRITFYQSPINASHMFHALGDYDTNERLYIVHGLLFGFHEGFEGPYISIICRNLTSVQSRIPIALGKVMKEVGMGRMQGPFDRPPLAPFRVNAIGLVPKQEPGSYRMITDLSHPKGASINSYIPDEAAAVQYQSVQSAVYIIQRLGPNCCLAKTDIKSAFRLIPLRPAIYSQMGIYVGDKYFIDKALPMGARSSSAIFSRFAKALVFIAKNVYGIKHIVYYLDDYLLINESFDLCKNDLEQFQKMCSHLGVPLAVEKTVGPSTCLTFLGIEIDTVAQELRLPLQKVHKAQKLITKFMVSPSVRVQSIQSLHGYLNHCAQVIPAGRAFLRRLSGLIKGREGGHVKLARSSGVREDLQVWLQFVQKFNGVALFTQRASTDLKTDASASLGFGAIHGSKYLWGLWPESIKELSLGITLLELYPIVVAVHTWANEMRNKVVHIYSDNLAVVHIINNLSSTLPVAMSLMRKFTLQCLHYNILFKAFHVAGTLNVGPDDLSRGRVQKFLEDNPSMNRSPTEVPAALLPQALLIP